MFNVNPWEMVIIVIIFLLVFGPERIPEIAVQAGKLYRDFRQAADLATDEISRELEFAAQEEASRKAVERRSIEDTGPPPATPDGGTPATSDGGTPDSGPMELDDSGSEADPREL